MSRPRLDGIVPIRLFTFTARKVSLDKLPNEEGMLPVKLVVLIVSVTKLDKLPKELGIEPPNRLDWT